MIDRPCSWLHLIWITIEIFKKIHQCVSQEHVDQPMNKAQLLFIPLNREFYLYANDATLWGNIFLLYVAPRKLYCISAQP